MELQIRKAISADLPGILALINELALYERAPAEVEVTFPALESYFENGNFEALVAMDKHGKVTGTAIYYDAYSTWKGKILYLDDLVVTRELRNSGIGTALFNGVISEACSKGANQLRWHVLDWNSPAISFYKKYQAGLDPEWVTGKLTREQLITLNEGNKSVDESI